MCHSQMGYGIGIIATITHDAGYTVKVIDNNAFCKFYRDKDFFKVIASYEPEVLAYSISIHNAYETYQQISKFKAQFPNPIVIAGGIHMKHSFQEALRHGVDVVVNREAEKVILPLLKHLEQRGRYGYKNELESIPGVSFIKEDGNAHFAKDHPSLENLDDVPLVDYDLFNISDFVKTKTEAGVFYLIGQRGCPFKCNFCSDEMQRADTRVASADWLFKNVVYMHNKYKVDYLSIVDNNFTMHRQRAVDFCKKIIESGLNNKITFSCQTSTQFSLDEELVCLMKEAGFCRIGFGIERLTPYSLEKINKEQPIEHVYEVLSLASKYFIDPTVYMMIGFPFETTELLQREKELFLGLTKYSKRSFLSVLCPMPGTIYYDNVPNIKEWYLNRDQYLISRAHFSNVLDMHTSHVIKKNFFGFSQQVQQSLIDYYSTFRKICYGSVFRKKSIILSLYMKLDFLIAKLSQAVFALSPSLEFFIFNRVKTIRYYLRNHFFSRNMRNN